MEKRYAASVVIYNEEGKVLLARRAPTKFPFPNVLSLPSTYIKNKDGTLASHPLLDSEVKQQLQNAVRTKLGIEIVLEDMIGSKEGVQANYQLHMTDYFARIVSGSIRPNGEDFTEAKYIDPVQEFNGKDRNKMGLCTRVLLEKLDNDLLFWKRYF